MSASECERYARSILNRIGGPTSEQYLTRIAKTMVPEDGGGWVAWSTRSVAMAEVFVGDNRVIVSA